MNDTPKTGLTYAEAGVDIDAGNALVDRIKPAAKATARPGVMSGLGGFGALFDLKGAGYSDPVLVAKMLTVCPGLQYAIANASRTETAWLWAMRPLATTSNKKSGLACCYF